MSQGLERAKAAFAFIDGDFDTRRGMMVGPNALLTALHGLHNNSRFDVHVPSIPGGGFKVSASNTEVISHKALDAALIKLPRSLQAGTWAEIAGRKPILSLGAHHLITDVSGTIQSAKLSVNDDATSNLQDIFDESRQPYNAAQFEALKANARLDTSHSGSIITNGRGEVETLVAGVIDDPNKPIGRRLWGAVGGKSNDVYVPKQNEVAAFLGRHL